MHQQSLTPRPCQHRRYLPDPRHTRLLSAVAHRLLDAYAAAVGASPEVDAQLALLREAVVSEAKLLDELAAVQGALEPLLAAGLAALAVNE